MQRDFRGYEFVKVGNFHTFCLGEKVFRTTVTNLIIKMTLKIVFSGI